MPTLLTLVEKNHPILREIMPKVTDFNDPELHDIIESMCYSILPAQLKRVNAPFENAAGMAANQWGIRKRIFIFSPEGSDENKKREVMINPSYMPSLKPGEKHPDMSTAYEGCFSVPRASGLVNRYDSILGTWYTPAGKKMERIMHGWEARVFQHETDHLDGKLYDGRLDEFAGPECLERIVFQNDQEMSDFWSNKVKPERENEYLQNLFKE